jgi:phytoene dehydrogenase-like protein
VLHRHVQRPRDIEDTDPNLVSGAVNGGTAQLFQQLVFRPVPGLGRSETVIDNLFLGSSSAHPGGGVHGVCGALAARAALRNNGLRGLVRRRAISAALNLLYRP